MSINVCDFTSRTDRELLHGFSELGSHAAFAALVKRHGPMVHAVSMRVLSNHHDAEDVTQAAFIILAREAGRLDRQASVAGWLHTVSRRLSLNARKSRESRRLRDENAINDPMHATPDTAPLAGFRRELDAALAGLPDKYRQALVLFHLEGASLQETAHRLDLHPTTLRTRLSRAREMLRGILSRRGVEIASVGVLATLLTAEAKAAALPHAFLGSVVDAATSGGASVAPRVLELAGKSSGSSCFSLTALTLLLKTKAKVAATILIALAAIGTGSYLVHRGAGIGDAHGGAGQPVAGSAPTLRSAKHPARPEPDPLSRISTREQFFALVDSVLLIADETERLAAIRETLGMEISDEAYRKAVAAHGYQIDPRGLYEKLSAAWTKDDHRAVTLWARRFPGEFGAGLLRGALAAWFLADEAAAMAWADENRLDPRLVAMAREDSHRWKQENENMPQLPDSSEGAAEMLQGMRERLRELYAIGPQASEERSALTRRLCSLMERWADRDAGAAVEFVFSLDSSTRNVLSQTTDLRNSIRKWAHADPDAALQWAKRVKHPQERLDAIAAVLPSWRLKHPDQGIEDAVDLDTMPDNKYHHLIEQLVVDLAVMDPPAALDYAMQLEEPELRSRMVADVVASWVRKDPAKVGEWALALPAGGLRDESLAVVCERLSMTDFAAAGQLVREIADQHAKHQAIHRMMTTGAVLKHHFDDALRLADREIPQLPYDDLRMWAHEVRPGDIPAFRAWLEQVRDADRIQWQPRHQTVAADPEKGYRFILEGLRTVQE